VEKVREERKRIAEAKAETERIARAVEAAAKRRMRKTKKKGDTTTKHAHFDANPESSPIDRPHTPPAIEAAPSPRKTLMRKATVPVYSVAGRKVSLFDLLREKILASGEGDSIAAQRAFKLAADSDGKIDAVAIAAVMRRFNVSATDDAVAAKGGSLLFADARDVLGPDADPELVRRLKELGDDCREGLIPTESLRDAVVEHQKSLSDAAVAQAKRDFIDGFGKGVQKGKAPPVAAPKPMDADDVEEILREKLAAKSAGGAAERRKAFHIFDKTNKGFIDRDAMVEALHHFHLALRPEDVDSLMAKYDSSGGGKISFQDFTDKLLPDDYPTASAKKARVVDAKIAGFTMELTGLLTEIEEMGGVSGSVARSEAIRAAEQAAKDARVRLPPSAAHHAADAASIDAHLAEHPRVELAKYIQSIVSIVRAAEEGAIETAGYEKEGVSEKFGDNSYVAPVALTDAGFAKKMSTAELLVVVSEKFSAKVPAGKAATWYYGQLMETGDGGAVTIDVFTRALSSVGLGAVEASDADALFAKITDGASTITVAQFTRALAPGPVRRPDANKLRESFETVDKAQVGALSEEDIRGVLVACDVEVDQAAIDRALSQCAADTDLRGPDAKGKIDYERFARAIGDVDLAGVNKSVAPTLETFGKEEIDVNDAAEGVEGVSDDVGVKTYSPETLKAMNVGCETPPRGVELGSDVEEPEEPRSPDSLPEPSPGHIEVKQWDGPVVKRINQL
jgi:Ca2+-binding EF-hand superfamily protein